MKKANFILSGICIIIAIYTIVTAMQFPEGTNGVPGPGVFPIIIATLMIASSVSIIISSIKMEDEKIIWMSENLKPVYISMAAVVVYTIALAQIGFVVTSVIFVSGMVQWLKKGSPIKNVLISVVFVGIVYGVFSGLLNVPMNFGILI
ncbi:MAG: tripartite tricarboxylate transporter TctB family protein [Eubacteriales bacterium]